MCVMSLRPAYFTARHFPEGSVVSDELFDANWSDTELLQTVVLPSGEVVIIARICPGDTSYFKKEDLLCRIFIGASEECHIEGPGGADGKVANLRLTATLPSGTTEVVVGWASKSGPWYRYLIKDIGTGRECYEVLPNDK
jgi:hypothetical protein